MKLSKTIETLQQRSFYAKTFKNYLSRSNYYKQNFATVCVQRPWRMHWTAETWWNSLVMMAVLTTGSGRWQLELNVDTKRNTRARTLRRPSAEHFGALKDIMGKLSWTFEHTEKQVEDWFSVGVIWYRYSCERIWNRLEVLNHTLCF